MTSENGHFPLNVAPLPGIFSFDFPLSLIILLLKLCTCPYISVSLRKKVCFRYLANWKLFASLGYFFRVGKNKVQGILHESRKVICKVLQPIYITVPTSEVLLQIADEFNKICKMLNCIGSRDRKHCSMKYPPNAGSFYCNYKSREMWLTQNSVSHSLM